MVFSKVKSLSWMKYCPIFLHTLRPWMIVYIFWNLLPFTFCLSPRQFRTSSLVISMVFWINNLVSLETSVESLKAPSIILVLCHPPLYPRVKMNMEGLAKGNSSPAALMMGFFKILQVNLVVVSSRVYGISLLSMQGFVPSFLICSWIMCGDGRICGLKVIFHVISCFASSSLF